jgi:hypothetical protein
MIKKTINFLYVIISSISLISVIIFYLSEENIKKKNKLRSMDLFSNSNLINDLPFLVNDTKDIIDYNISTKEKKNKKYYKFFELLKKTK